MSIDRQYDGRPSATISAEDPGAVTLLIKLRGERVHAAREDIGQTAQQIDLDL